MKKIAESRASEAARKRFRRNLKKFRKMAGLTQVSMAERLKISPPQYNHYESGYRFPSYFKLCLIADVLNTKVEALLGAAVKPLMEVEASLPETEPEVRKAQQASKVRISKWGTTAKPRRKAQEPTGDSESEESPPSRG